MPGLLVRFALVLHWAAIGFTYQKKMCRASGSLRSSSSSVCDRFLSVKEKCARSFFRFALVFALVCGRFLPIKKKWHMFAMCAWVLCVPGGGAVCCTCPLRCWCVLRSCCGSGADRCALQVRCGFAQALCGCFYCRARFKNRAHCPADLAALRFAVITLLCVLRAGFALCLGKLRAV